MSDPMKPLPQGISDKGHGLVREFEGAMIDVGEYMGIEEGHPHFDEINARARAALSSLEQYIASLEADRRLLDELERLHKAQHLWVTDSGIISD